MNEFKWLKTSGVMLGSWKSILSLILLRREERPELFVWDLLELRCLSISRSSSSHNVDEGVKETASPGLRLTAFYCCCDPILFMISLLESWELQPSEPRLSWHLLRGLSIPGGNLPPRWEVLRSTDRQGLVMCFLKLSAAMQTDIENFCLCIYSFALFFTVGPKVLR